MVSNTPKQLITELGWFALCGWLQTVHASLNTTFRKEGYLYAVGVSLPSQGRGKAAYT